MNKNFRDYFPLIWAFARPRWLSLLFCFLPMVYAGLHLSLEPYLLKTLIDRVLAQGNTEIVRNEFWLAICLPLLGLAIVSTWRIRDFAIREFVPTLKTEIVEHIFTYVTHHSHRFFQETLSGQIANKMKEVQAALEEIMEILTEGFRGLITVLISVLFMISIHPMLGGILLFWTTIFVSFSFVLYRSAVPIAESYSETRSVAFGKIVDSLANHSVVQLFSRHLHERKLIRSFLKQAEQVERALRLKMMFIWTFLGLIFCGCQGFLIFALLYLRERNLVTIGDFAFVLWSSVSVLEQTWMITERLSKISQNIGICKDGLSLVAKPHEVTDRVGARPLQVGSGRIEFQSVTFRHQGASSNLFEDLSLQIEPGSKVGLVGFSGSGKSSFTHLLVRLFDIQSGEIKIDGQNIASVTQESLREKIGFIPQDPTLFHRTLKDNLAYAKPEASLEEIQEACKSARAHDFVLQTPQGYDSLVGERGIKLSGGQRQRVAIARAILKNAPLLVLDEATSALDSVTEGEIQGCLTELMANKTCIVIAHRLSTLLEMDRILVFDSGRIREDGNHTSLLKKGGLYATLWKSQVGGFIQETSRSGLTTHPHLERPGEFEVRTATQA